MATEKSNSAPKLIAHIGWDLWRAALHWDQRFKQAMVEKGYVFFAEARSNLLQYIGREGVVQSALASRASMSKQAVQQHLDLLEMDGIVERVDDEFDSRRKVVRFTQKGKKVLAVANQVKRNIEKEYEQKLGKNQLDHLKNSLRLIAED